MDRSKSALLVLALAAIACQEVVTTPIQAATTPEANGLSETIPSTEVDQLYSGEVIPTVDQNIIDSLSESSGYPKDQIGGYTVVINRSAQNMSDLEIGFGIAPEEVPDGNGQMKTVNREYMFSNNLPNGAIGLYRKFIESPIDGKEPWLELGYYTYEGDVIGAEQPVLRYPINTMDLHNSGDDTKVLFYPPPEMQGFDLPNASGKPILLNYKGEPMGNMVDLAQPTPFSDQVIDISFSPKTPEPPQISSTVAPATVVASTTTAENTPTQEVPILNPGYTLNIDPTNIIGPVLTSNDINGPHATWINKKCKIPSAENTTIKAGVYDKDKEQIVLFAMREGLPAQARNVQICSIDKVDASAFGMTGKDALFLVSQNFADRYGNQLTFQVLLGQSGIDNMVNNKILPTQTDKYGPRMSILSKLSRDQQTKFLLNGATGGSGDPRLFTDEDLENFYSTQGTSLEEVNRMLQHISENGGNIDDESIKFFSRVVVFGFPSNPPTAD